jgi:hypothetical protein
MLPNEKRMVRFLSLSSLGNLVLEAFFPLTLYGIWKEESKPLFRWGWVLCAPACLKFSCCDQQSDWNRLCLLIEGITEAQCVKEELILRSQVQGLSLGIWGKSMSTDLNVLFLPSVLTGNMSGPFPTHSHPWLESWISKYEVENDPKCCSHSKTVESRQYLMRTMPSQGLIDITILHRVWIKHNILNANLWNIRCK